MTPRARRSPLPTVLSVGLVVLGALVGGVAAAGRAREIRAERAELLAEQRAAIERRIEDWVDDSLDALEGVRGLMTLGDPGRAGFATYVEQLRDEALHAGDVDTFQELQIVGFARRVPEAELDAFLEQRADVAPAEEGAEAFDREYGSGPHYIVDYVVPSNSALGADLADVDSRRVPMERARDTGRATASNFAVPLTEVELPPDEQDRLAALYLPVYTDGLVPRSVDDRREQLTGWVLSALRASRFGERIMPPDVVGRGRLQLYDGTGVDVEQLAVDTFDGAGSQLSDEHAVWRMTELGQVWTLRYTPTVDELGRAEAGLPPWLLFAAIFLAGLVPGAVIWQLGRARARAEERVEETLEELARSERSLRSLADTAPVAIFDLDARQRVTFGNEAWGQLVDGAAATGGPAWLPNVHPDDARGLIDDWHQALRSGDALRGRYRLRGRGEAVRWVDVSAVPILDDAEGFVRAVGCVVDVSQVVEFEHELAAARDQALVASQMKSDFLANVSHEVRTPLNGVIGMAELLLGDELSPVQHERVRALHSAGSYLLDLVDEVLDFSKIEAGKIKIEHVDFDLHALVEEQTAIWRAAAQDRSLSFSATAAADVPRWVRGDPIRLRQVLGNLLSNAMKFTHAGSVRSSVSVEHRAERSVVVRFEVIDTGIGIPRAAQRLVFDPFTQADGSTTRRYGGTGLGLAICSELVALMGGEIGVTSEQGGGSTFWFNLPLTVVAETGSEVLRPAGSTTDGRRGPPVTTAPLRPANGHPVDDDAVRPRILLVEDNLVNQMVARGLLESLDYDVDVAADGVEALDVLADHGSYDAVLMDCQMPRLDGFATTERLRAQEGDGDHIPVIAMTASAMAEDRQRCLESGMDDFVAKPVRREVLADALGRALRP